MFSQGFIYMVLIMRDLLWSFWCLASKYNKKNFLTDSQNIDCRSPEGLAGTCMVIQRCNSVYSAVKKVGYISQQVQQYLQKSFCGFEGSYSKICCPAPTSGNRSPNSKQKTKPAVSDPRMLLPQKCGIDNSNRIVGGEMMSLEEFPWLALLEYQSRKFNPSFFLWFAYHKTYRVLSACILLVG